MKTSEQLTPGECALRISPLGRAGNTEDMAGYILWLASSGAWLSGNIIVTDGGKLGIIPSGY